MINGFNSPESLPVTCLTPASFKLEKSVIILKTSFIGIILALGCLFALGGIFIVRFWKYIKKIKREKI
jgi:hypothetical protein